ncbi:GNAT family N-acetyltransferase [Flavihumibacter sp. R14]|nr:GNAT family N-acetyltransferase [Flavihumibacter soli]
MPHIEQIPLELALRVRLRAMYPGQKREVAELADDADGIHFGLFDNNKLISVASWFRRNESEAQFRKLATLEEFRNSGYGTSLMRYIMEFSKGENIRNLWCNARVSAGRFYKKLGFTETGHSFAKNGIDYVIMTVNLGDE